MWSLPYHHAHLTQKTHTPLFSKGTKVMNNYRPTIDQVKYVATVATF